MTKKSKSASSADAQDGLARPETPKPAPPGESQVSKRGGLVFVGVIVGLMLLVIAIDLLRR